MLLVLLNKICLQFTFIGGEPRPKSLKDFSWEKSPFSKKFRKANTAKEFTEIWDIHVAPCLDKKMGEYTKSSSQATSAPHEASAAAHKNTGSALNMQKCSSEVLPLELPKPKKQKQESEEEEHKEQEKRIDDCFVGKCM